MQYQGAHFALSSVSCCSATARCSTASRPRHLPEATVTSEQIPQSRRSPLNASQSTVSDIAQWSILRYHITHCSMRSGPQDMSLAAGLWRRSGPTARPGRCVCTRGGTPRFHEVQRAFRNGPQASNVGPQGHSPGAPVATQGRCCPTTPT
jgi:hypothetical protein